MKMAPRELMENLRKCPDEENFQHALVSVENSLKRAFEFKEKFIRESMTFVSGDETMLMIKDAVRQLDYLDERFRESIKKRFTELQEEFETNQKKESDQIKNVLE